MLSVVRVPDLDAAIELDQRVALRQLRDPLHRRPAAPRAVPPAHRGRDARRQHRGRRPGRLVPLRRLEGLHGRRPARQRRTTPSPSTPAGRWSPRDGHDPHARRAPGARRTTTCSSSSPATGPSARRRRLPGARARRGRLRLRHRRRALPRRALRAVLHAARLRRYGEEIAEAAAAQLRDAAVQHQLVDRDARRRSSWPPRWPSARPATINHVFFTSGGSESVESAWKIARQHFSQKGEPQRHEGDRARDRLPRREPRRARASPACATLQGAVRRRPTLDRAARRQHQPLPRSPTATTTPPSARACSPRSRPIIEEGPETIAMLIGGADPERRRLLHAARGLLAGPARDLRPLRDRCCTPTRSSRASAASASSSASPATAARPT